MFVYLKKYIHYAILGAIFMVAEVAMDLLQPIFMTKIVDDGVLGLAANGLGNYTLIIMLGTIMVFIALMGGVCGSLNNILVNYSSQNIGNLIRKNAFKNILSFSFPQIEKIGPGSLITRVTNDVTQIENSISMFVRGMVRTLLMLVGSLYCMFRINSDFGYIALITVPFIILGLVFCMKKVEPLFISMQDSLDEVNNILQEDISGIRIIKASVREIYEKLRFGKANDKLIKRQLKVLLFFAFLHPITNCFMYLAIAFILWDGAKDVAAGVSTPGNIMAALTYTTQLLHSILMMIMVFQIITRGSSSWKRIKYILNIKPEINSNCNELIKNDSSSLNEKSEENQQPKIAVEFKNVSFAYPDSGDRLVLENINLRIFSGETIAIMGATGCGKSSLINLIPRFYDTTSGSVFLNGIDVKEYDLNVLRQKVSIVLQKTELFSDTIKNNIKWGRPDASEEEVEKASEIAQASEFVEKLSEGYNEILSERGMSLSGGQKQRISIARAMIKESDIIIFDDSTSALDLKTESLLYDALNEAKKNTTKIIVAQRVTSVKRADKIVVIEKGKICAIGSHNELINNCQTYKDIYNSQTGGEIINGC